MGWNRELIGLEVHNGPNWGKEFIPHNKAWPVMTFMAFIYIESYIMLNKAFGLQLNFWPQNILKADGGNVKETKPYWDHLYLLCHSILMSTYLLTSETFDRINFFITKLVCMPQNTDAWTQHARTCMQTSQKTAYSEKLPIPAESATPSWVAHYIVVVVNRDIRTENQDTPAPI